MPSRAMRRRELLHLRALRLCNALQACGKVRRLTNDCLLLRSARPDQQRRLRGIGNPNARQSPVWQPETTPPRPWTGLNEGGTWHPELQKVLKIIRSRHEETDQAVSAAIHEGKMEPALAALNALQAVSWKINQRVLNVLHDCTARRVAVKGLPSSNDLPMPTRPPRLSKTKERAWEEREHQYGGATAVIVMTERASLLILRPPTVS